MVFLHLFSEFDISEWNMNLYIYVYVHLFMKLYIH